MFSRLESTKSWVGYERRKRPRRAEDLKRCMLCGVLFSWHSCSPMCSVCGHKLISQHQYKGKILNIFV